MASSILSASRAAVAAAAIESKFCEPATSFGCAVACCSGADRGRGARRWPLVFTEPAIRQPSTPAVKNTIVRPNPKLLASLCFSNNVSPIILRGFEILLGHSLHTFTLDYRDVTLHRHIREFINLAAWPTDLNRFNLARHSTAQDL